MLRQQGPAQSPWIDTSQLLSVDDLLFYREGQVLDFKNARIHPRDLAEILVAFANADGGTVVLGVEDNKTVSGTRHYQSNVAEILRAPFDHCEPPVSMQVEELSCRNADGETDALLLLHVVRSQRVHSTTRKVTLVRIGDQNRRLNAQDVIQLAYDKGQAEYEVEETSGATLADLDSDLLFNYQETVGAQGEAHKVLKARELATGNGNVLRLNMAGVLLFAQRPQHWHPRCGIRVVKWEGTERRTGADLNVVKDRQIELPLPKLLDETFDFVGTLLREFTRLGPDGKFVTTPEFPPFVWQEAITNAVVHRSYANRGRQTEVFLFDDHLEVQSPGELPASLRADTLRGSHFSRNPRIVRVMAELRYVRDFGEGIDRMFREMEAAGLPPPEFEEIPGALKVTLRNGLSVAAVPSAQRRLPLSVLAQLNDRQKRVLEVVAQQGSITNSQCQQLFSVSYRTAHRDLSQLVEFLLLKPQGRGRATRYTFR
ncbi:putative DNA binding domain-containing protein [Candidatus Poribacteria bacterium]|nr:putative DNA binding domain-containing protein [Candidatus Poribacteria bacterium]